MQTGRSETAAYVLIPWVHALSAGLAERPDLFPSQDGGGADEAQAHGVRSALEVAAHHGCSGDADLHPATLAGSSAVFWG